MLLSFSVHHSFTELPIDWKKYLTDDSVCKGIDMVENANVPDLKNLYVITYQDREPIFVAYFQLLQVGPQHFYISHKRAQQASLNLALRIVKPTLLVAGNLFRHDVLFYIYLREHLNAAEKAQVYEQTIQHLISYTNASGIFIKDVEESIGKFIQQDDSYMQMPEDISMELKLPSHWATFNDYEKDLKHKYVQRCRKIRKAFVDVKIIELSLTDIEKYANKMEHLYLQVTERQMVSMGKINSTFFVELKQSLQENYVVCGFFLGDKMIGFSSAILHHQTYDMNYIGIDYEYNSSHQLYFNILFHCVQNAIATKSSKLILGRTALEAKAIIGCDPDYRYSFYKLRNVVVNWFYKLVATNFREAQGDKWKDRHPFKSIHYASSKTI